MLNCLVITHGNLAEAIVETAEGIAGECEGIYILRVEGLNLKQMRTKIVELVERKRLQEGLFILVCLKGGSGWNAAAAVALEYENIEVISGVNLPMMLTFMTRKSSCDFNELREALISEGKEGITGTK